MADDPDKTTEVWIADGEVWFPDAAALCARLHIDYLTYYDSDVYAGVQGKGEVALADLLAEEGKRGNVTAIK